MHFTSSNKLIYKITIKSQKEFGLTLKMYKMLHIENSHFETKFQHKDLSYLLVSSYI